MAATLTAAMADCSPGNVVALAGTGLGTSGSLSLAAQGLVTPAPLAITPTAWSDTSATFVVPDGATSAMLTVTAHDGSTATCWLEIVPQYLQAAQYNSDGEGIDTSALGTGVLDDVLRDASAMVTEIVGSSLRLLQVQEDHRFSDSRRIWPFRGPQNRIPIVSLDALTFITSNAIQTSFTVSGSAPDVYVNKSLGYFEVQTYAIGNAMLLGEIQTVGFSANQWRVTYTSGFGWMQTPRAIRKATAIIASELLVYRGLISDGLGGLSRVRKGQIQYDRRNEPFAVPQPALDLLRSYAGGNAGSYR